MISQKEGIMNYKQKLFYAFAGFLLGNIILGSIAYGINYVSNYQSSKNEITFVEALKRIEGKEINKVIIDDKKVEFNSIFDTKYSANLTEEQREKVLQRSGAFGLAQIEFLPKSDPIASIFQILFWLFFLSPPIIVVLLLVIISKMKSNNSIK